MQSTISFVLDGRIRSLDLSSDPCLGPTTTVLNYLRSLPDHKGTKEGCAEGDCGACTVVFGELTNDGVIRYRAVDSCLVFLPMLHGKQLITVEDVKRSSGELHPVQQAMIDTGGSQCGYCTPGFIMSLFALYKCSTNPSRGEVEDALTGNLCRCTGYRPIVEAASRSCVHAGIDHFTDSQVSTASLLRSIAPDTVAIQTPLQQYWKPSTLDEGLRLVDEHPESIVITGATDVALRVTKKHELLREVIDLSDVWDLKRIENENGEVHVGAGANLSDVLVACRDQFPALHSMLSVFGSLQIRNLATLGGNLGSASPIGDTLPVLMAYRAGVELQSRAGRRRIPVDEFIVGYRKTVRRLNELITKIVLPLVRDTSIVRSYKVSKRKDLDIATVSAGFRLERNERNEVTSIVLAYGGMAERTRRATAAEEFLIGKPWERETVERAVLLTQQCFAPISDARAGAAFRRVAAGNMLLKFLVDTTCLD